MTQHPMTRHEHQRMADARRCLIEAALKLETPKDAAQAIVLAVMAIVHLSHVGAAPDRACEITEEAITRLDAQTP